MGAVPPKFFLPSAPYGSSQATTALSPVAPAAQNPQTPLLPPNFTDPGTMSQQTQQTPMNPSLQSARPQSKNPLYGMFGRGLFALLLLLPSSLWATTAVTGKIQTLGTGNITSGAFVRFWLRGCAGNQPRVNGTSVIGPTQGGVFFFDFAADGSGNVSGTLYSTRDAAGTGNGDIECGGSKTAVWYGMQIWVAGKAGPEVAVHAKNTGTLDITQVTPLTTNPVVTSPTGDGTYLRLDAGNSPVTGNVGLSGAFAQTGTATPVTRSYSANQAGLSSMYVDWARPTCTGPAIVGFMAAFSVHAEDTPTYDATLSSSTPCQTVALFPVARRSGTRTDQIWAVNPVVAYNNAGSVQGIEIDYNNFYQDYVIGGADTNGYAGIAVVTQGSKQPDKAITVDRTGIAGLWRRGIYLSAVSDRAIEVNASPLWFLYADSNQSNFIAGTWNWQSDITTHPIFSFTPKADDTNTEIYGTNAANSLVKWSIDNSGNGSFLTLKAGGGTALASTNQSGTGSLCMTTGCALTTPTLSGVTNGTGLQLFNTTTTCTTGASIGATCTTAAITLPVAEADTSYRIVCTGKGLTNVPVVIATTNSSATQFTITIAALTAAAASFASYDCSAGHN